jgi:transcription elongation factor Elf1
MQEFTCSRCGIKLTSENWYESDKSRPTHRCKQCRIKQEQKYQRTHHKDYLRSQRKYAESHREQKRKQTKEWAVKVKIEVLVHYSGTNPPQCANPFGEHKEPYTTIEALTIEHPNQDGAEDRERIFGRRRAVGGIHFYLWLRDHNYPEGYEVLCFNCQWIRRIRWLKQQNPYKR